MNLWSIELFQDCWSCYIKKTCLKKPNQPTNQQTKEEMTLNSPVCFLSPGLSLPKWKHKARGILRPASPSKCDVSRASHCCAGCSHHLAVWWAIRSP